MSHPMIELFWIKDKIILNYLITNHLYIQKCICITLFYNKTMFIQFKYSIRYSNNVSSSDWMILN